MKNHSLSQCPICSSGKIILRDRFYVCRTCGYESAGIINVKELDDYYNKNDVGLQVQNILEGRHESSLRNYHKKAIDVIKRCKPNTSICDIGCGVGTFLHVLQEKKFKVYGYDINEAQSTIAKKKYRLKNVYYAESLNDYCKKKNIKKNSFDVVSSFEVIEHIPDVNGFIEEVRGFLKKDGLLIISTPNSKRLPLRERWDYPPIHLSRFNKKNIEILLRKHNFKLVSWTTYNELGYYSNNFIHKLAVSQKMLTTMVNSQQDSKTLEKQLNVITNVKKITCYILDIPLFLLLLPFRTRGHTMFFVAKKIA